MDQLDFDGSDLPEFYITDDGQKVAAPTYEAMATCYMPMTSVETGQTGPTRIEAGEHFTSERAPSHAWRPLNRAAGENYQKWLASLPPDGKGVPQDLITQAAYMLRPREGDPEFPIEMWWPKVLQLASQLHDKQRVNGAVNPKPGSAFRPGGAPTPVMPFASAGNTMIQPGGPPPNAALHQPQNPIRAAQAQRQKQTRPPMPNTLPPGSPQTA
jgi:hypothetical protein